MDSPNSVYIVHSRFLGLTKQPFLPAKLVRPNFHSIFNSKGCFTDFFTRRHEGLPDLFIPRLGAIGLGTATERMATPYPTYCYSGSLDYLKLQFSDHLDENFYARYEELRDHNVSLEYVDQLQDQRMVFLFFELLNPIKLIARQDNNIMAKAKLFFHIYPSGYVVSHLAISLTERAIQTLNLTTDVFKELRPWRRNSTWLWSSRLGNLKLNQTLKEVDSLMQKSFLTQNTQINKNSKWTTSIKVRSRLDASKLAFKWFNISETFEPFYFSYKSSLEEILVINQGALCTVAEGATRGASLRLFWSIQLLQEIIYLKEKIYRDYINIFQSELMRMKEFRLSTKKRLDEQSMTEFFVFNEDIARHLWVLDKVIQQKSALYRALYSYLADETELDDIRAKATKLLNEWEQEVALYDPLIVALWKKFISPLSSIIGGG